MKKKFCIFVFIGLITAKFFSIGYSVNVGFLPGISGTAFGKQIEKNQFLDNSSFENLFTLGGFVNGEVIFAEDKSVQAGFEIKNVNLNYQTVEGNKFAYQTSHFSYTVFSIPVLFNYLIPLKKTTTIVSSVGFSAGPYFSYIVGNQFYRDGIDSAINKIISPNINIGVNLNVKYSHLVGPGNLFIGLNTQFNCLPQKYYVSDSKLNMGNTFFISPIIGYTFKIKEDKFQSKVTEKNKRIKDIVVK